MQNHYSNIAEGEKKEKIAIISYFSLEWVILGCTDVRFIEGNLLESAAAERFCGGPGRLGGGPFSLLGGAGLILRGGGGAGPGHGRCGCDGTAPSAGRAPQGERPARGP